MGKKYNGFKGSGLAPRRMPKYEINKIAQKALENFYAEKCMKMLRPSCDRCYWGMDTVSEHGDTECFDPQSAKITLYGAPYKMEQETVDIAVRNCEPVAAAVKRLAEYEDAEEGHYETAEEKSKIQ